MQLIYTGVSKDSNNLDRLEKFAEIYTNELEVDRHKRFLHRLLLSNGSEIQIEFLDLSVYIFTKTAKDYENIKILKKQSRR